MQYISCSDAWKREVSRGKGVGDRGIEFKEEYVVVNLRTCRGLLVASNTGVASQGEEATAAGPVLDTLH